MKEINKETVSSKIQKLDLAFQPIVEVTEVAHVIWGYEILLRYLDGDFFPFPLFEELIATEEGCDLLNEWYGQKISHYLELYPNTHFSLNVDFQQMLYPSTWKMLEKVGQYNQRLSIELTEFYQVSNNEYQELFPKVMHYIRNLGMRIAFDDVGNGLHSLAFVTCNIRYVDSIKLSLLHFKHIDQKTISLYIEVWMRVAKEFNVEFVVEGVENEVLANMLVAKGVIYQQGYYWSEPCKIIGSNSFKVN